MIRAALRRGLAFVGTLLGATAFVMALLVLAPGDPIDLLPDGEAQRATLEAQWGLDRPLPERYATTLARALTLDLGTSLTYRPGQPVIEVVAGPALRTLGLVAAAVVCALAGGLGLALWTAGRRRRGWLVQAVSIVPVFLLAHTLVLGINELTWSLVQSQTIGRPDWFALPDQPSALRTTLAIAVLAIGSGALSEAHGQIESSLVEIRKSPFVDALRARGQSAWPHVLANLVPPMAATMAERAAFLAGGAVIAEKVLLINGVGAVLWEAALLRDYDLALAIALFAAAFVGLARLAADGIRLAVDPRMQQ